jgi:hypothetical protein
MLSADSKETLLKYDTAVKVWDSKEPVWHWGDQVWGYKATLCNLVLTDRRLIIVKVSDSVDTGYKIMIPAWDVLDTLLTTGAEKGVASMIGSSHLDNLQGESIPLQNIQVVESKRYWKNMSGASYLSIRYQCNGEVRQKSIIFGEGFKGKGEWVEEITKAKNLV